MKNMIKRFRENRKGFTLVEILVVLVILAILAAVSIPSMVGFIDQARGKAHIAECRTVYVAAQAAVSEEYGVHSGDTGYSAATSVTNSTSESATTPDGRIATSMNTMLDGSIPSGATYTVTIADANVESVAYVIDGYTITLTAGGGVTVTQ